MADNENNLSLNSDDDSDLDEEIDDELSEEDDDIDEEEEEDDEEDDDDRYSKRSKRNHGGFIIDEAEVDDSEEEDEVQSEAGFSEYQSSAEKDLYKRRSRETEFEAFLRTNDNEEDIEKFVQERYTDSQSQGLFKSKGKLKEIERQKLLPGVKDPNLWMVKCKRGEERNTAILLMRKAAVQKNQDSVKIRSVLAFDGIKGFIYVEAYKQSHVKEAIDGISALKYGVWSQKMVPIREMTDVMRVVKERMLVEPKSWVRFRRGLYRDDLAQVERIDPSRESVLVKVIPRIDYTSISLNSEEAKKRKMSVRPPSRMFDRDKIKILGGPIHQEGSFLVFDGGKYMNGFHYRKIRISSLYINGITPTLGELEKFNSNLESAAVVEMDIPENDFAVGERVEVISGQLTHLLGTVVSSNGQVVRMMPNHEELKDVLEFSSSELKKFFKVGDHVKTLRGRHQGESGMVVRVENSVVIVFSDTSMRELKVLPRDLQLCADKSSGIDSSGRFQIGDFVQIDPQTVGVIMGLEKESVAVLNQFGKVVNLKPHQLHKQLAKNGMFLDSQKNQIFTNDHVKVIDGPHKGVSGKIKQLFRGFVFIQSKQLVENGFLFVTRCRNVVREDTGSVNMATQGNFDSMANPSNANFFAMSPRINPSAPVGGPGSGFSKPAFSGGMGGGADRGKRDFSLNGKSVKIVQGPYKGNIGMVKDTAPTFVRVELYTNCKTITVDRLRVVVINPDGSTSSAGNETASGNRTPGAMAGGRTPMHSSMTPIYGRQTPMYSGGQTPMYDGSRTPRSSSGSMTPHTDGGTGSFYEHGSVWDPTSSRHLSDSSRTSDSFGGIGGDSSASCTSPMSIQSPMSIFGRSSVTPSNESNVDSPENSTFSPADPHVQSRGYSSGSSHSYYAPSPFVASTDYSITSGLYSYLSAGQDLTEFQLFKNIRVEILPSCENFQYAGKHAVVKDCSDMESVHLRLAEGFDDQASEFLIELHAAHLIPSVPTRGDKVRVLSGEHQGRLAKLISIDGPDGLIELEEQTDVSGINTDSKVKRELSTNTINSYLILLSNLAPYVSEEIM